MNAVTTTAARVGMWASAAAGLFTFLFAVVLNVPYWDCFVCMPLALSYLLVTLGNKHTVIDQNIIFADAAVIFGAIYCTCGSIVYYVQISFIRLANPSPEVLSVVQQPPPSAFFALDMLAYTFLGLSTVFLAFSIEASWILKVLLVLNGVDAVGGFVVPLMAFVYEPSNENDTTYNVILYGWCALFLLICVLLCLHFRRMLILGDNGAESSEGKGGVNEKTALLRG